MELLSNPWVFALFTFFLGIGGGIFIHKSKSPENAQNEKLKGEKDALQAEFDEYKGSVAAHFSQTSEMLNGLTENYAKVYRHLAESSQNLTGEELPALKSGISEEQLTASVKQIEGEKQSHSENGMEAPRDYAPKPQDQESEGTLSEAFSIKSGSQEAQEPEEVLQPTEQKLA